jgi:hypothetical protein
VITSSDKDDFASKARNISIGVEGDGRHRFGRLCGCDVEEWKCVVTKVLLLRSRAAILSNQTL